MLPISKQRRAPSRGAASSRDDVPRYVERAASPASLFHPGCNRFVSENRVLGSIRCPEPSLSLSSGERDRSRLTGVFVAGNSGVNTSDALSLFSNRGRSKFISADSNRDRDHERSCGYKIAARTGERK